MKKVILTFTILSIAVINGVSAQTEDTLSYAENEVRKNYAVYHLAKRFNDPVIARMALYQILIYSPNEAQVLDSLALEYYGRENYVSTALVTKEVLKAYPKDVLALEVGGLALNSIGLKDQALENFEKLFLVNNETNTLYQMAFLQYELKKYKESKTSVDILLKRSDVDAQNLVFPKSDKTEQEVSMRAALTNLQGLIAQAEGNVEQAKNFYLEALKLAPGFELAQANLSKAGK